METRAAPLRRTACPGCGRGVPEDEVACSLCGTLMRRDAFVANAGPRQVAGAPPPPPPPLRPDGARGLPPGLVACAVGAALAAVLGLAPVLRFAGWFLASLFHETGHAAAGWWLGTPAYPAIRLDGHAVAVHREWSPVLAVLGFAATAGLAAWARRRRALLATFAALAAVQPLLAFTSAREAAFLAAGHVGEIAFGAFFLSRGVAGGFTESRAERAAHAGVGLLLLGRNVALSAGLLGSEDARVLYAESGSLGLVNDYLRLAHDVLGTTLETVAAGSLVLALLGAAVGVALGVRGARGA